MNFVKKFWLLLLMLLGLHLLLLINLQFTAWPEMFSYAFLRNNGFLLYKDMVYPYPPVLVLGLSILYKLFGYKLIVLKLATWAIILVSDILIFLIVKKVTSRSLLAVGSLLFYVLTQPFLSGNQLWFDLAILPPVLLGTFFFLDKKYLLSGVFLGVAALTKQTAVLFLVVSGLWLLITEKRFNFVIKLAAGPLFLFLVLLVRLITEGAVQGFFNWTVVYPLTYWGEFPGYVEAVLNSREWLVVILLSLPAIILFLRKNYLLLIIYYLLSIIMVYPRFSFFHFQLAIAFSAILFGVSLKSFKVPRFLFITYYFLLITFITLPALKTSWQKETRFWGASDLRLASIVQKEVDGSVYLLGPHSGLYVMAGKLPPKPWVDNFGWYFEVPGVQEQAIKSWRENPPGVVIIQDPNPGEWFEIGTYQPKEVITWINGNYNKEKEISSGLWLWRKK